MMNDKECLNLGELRTASGPNICDGWKRLKRGMVSPDRLWKMGRHFELPKILRAEH
jgi:hypothetical protein